MEKNNKRIDRVIKKLQEIYFLDSALFKKKGKGRSDAENGRDPVPHEEKQLEQEPEMEREEDPKEETVEDGVANVEASRQRGSQKRPVTEVVDLTKPETKSIWKKKLEIEKKSYSRRSGTTNRRVELKLLSGNSKGSTIKLFSGPTSGDSP